MNNVKRFAAVIAMLMIAVFAFYVGTMSLATTASADVLWPVQAPTSQVIPENVTETERMLATIYDRVSPSIVSINVVKTATNRLGNESFAAGTGTGFIINDEGNIVTNSHVVQDATRIEVNFFDGRIVRGEIVGTDLDSDLAVIDVDVPPETLTPIALGDSDQLFVGQSVIAIGSPFSQPWTMTTGIISALDRTISGLNAYSIGAVIQTDAAINPGNSGGPLLNLQGEVIGVNSQINTTTQSNSGVGYAIPVNLVKRVAPDLIDDGVVDYSYLGITGGDIDLSVIEALSLPNNARGVVVSSVARSGPAAAAGLLSATNNTVDIITAIDGTPMTGMASLIEYLASSTAPGQVVNLSIVRNGTQELTLPVTLTGRP